MMNHINCCQKSGRWNQTQHTPATVQKPQHLPVSRQKFPHNEIKRQIGNFPAWIRESSYFPVQRYTLKYRWHFQYTKAKDKYRYETQHAALCSENIKRLLRYTETLQWLRQHAHKHSKNHETKSNQYWSTKARIPTTYRSFQVRAGSRNPVKSITQLPRNPCVTNTINTSTESFYTICYLSSLKYEKADDAVKWMNFSYPTATPRRA